MPVPDLAAYAQGRGYNATHVSHRGWQGTKDPALMPLIQNEGFIFVTSNGKDFLKLYADTDIHSGLIIVVHGNSRAEIQVRLFGLALDEAERLSYLTNKLVEVFEDGRVTVRDYPLEDAAGGSPL